MLKNKTFSAIVILLTISNAWAANKKKSQRDDAPPKAKAVEVDTTKFNNDSGGTVNAPAPDTEPLPQLGQAEDNYSLSTQNPADFFRVPESIREIRDIARKESLLKSEKNLFDYIREQRNTAFDGETSRYEKIIQAHQEFLSKVFFQKSYTDGWIDTYYKKNPDLKEAVTYFGIFRLYGVHGKLGTVELVPQPQPPATFKTLDDGTQVAIPTKEVPPKKVYTAAPEKILQAQRIEFGFHHYAKDSEGTPYYSLASRYGINESEFKFSAELAGKASDFVRRIGLDFIWDLREKVLPLGANLMNQQLQTMLEEYVPYDRVYVDVFKQNAWSKGSPEFLAIWRSKGSARKFRQELVGAGLITTGSETSSPWATYGDKGKPGNTPDGVWRIWGFNKHFKGFGGSDMRGLIQLSYGNGKTFSGRGFHHVFFYSPWGTNASHGCFRSYTNTGDETGLANVLWATINPQQLNNVDVTDFGNEGDIDRNIEPQAIREAMRAMRERVWISNFSEKAEGYRINSDATYSVQIRRQYDNYFAQTGISVPAVGKKLMNGGAQTIVGSGVKTTGKYWVYNKDIRNKLFEINLH